MRYEKQNIVQFRNYVQWALYASNSESRYVIHIL
jgi:hypothetical protein